MEVLENLFSVEASPPKRRTRQQGRRIREFLLAAIDKRSVDAPSAAVIEFKITRQAANKHINRLIKDGLIVATGHTRNRRYRLRALREWEQSFTISPGLAEHDVWDDHIYPLLREYPKNVLDIWQFCFTEMFNNAIDHSGGSTMNGIVSQNAVGTEMVIRDNGIGIFNKIQAAMNLPDPRIAILELAKGKLTTDPANHSGQGIFFTSRLLDSFDILSGGFCFDHQAESEQDWMLERTGVQGDEGTTILMKLNNHSARKDADIFAKYSSEDGVSFAKTVVPVTLARYGNEKLVSRSQAKQLLCRVDQFETVLLDFSGVDAIGQAFADEIFRVFARSHPNIKIVPIKASASILGRIEAARAGWVPASLRTGIGENAFA